LPAKLIEDRKRLKYSNLAASIVSFLHVDVETLGALEVDATDFMHQLGRRIAAVTGERWATDYLFQTLSVAIQRGKAAADSGTTVDLAADILDAVFIYNF